MMVSNEGGTEMYRKNPTEHFKMEHLKQDQCRQLILKYKVKKNKLSLILFYWLLCHVMSFKSHDTQEHMSFDVTDVFDVSLLQ